MDTVFLNNFMQKFRADNGVMRFISAIRGGDNKVLHNSLMKQVALDDSWVLAIEGAIFSIEQIVRNPRKFIAEEELIVDVAKARRVTTRTVRHLTSHSQFVESIAENGDVRPRKLLVVELDEDLAIYENRFVCALISRLVQFVEQRYRELNGNMEISQQTNVSLSSKFEYGGSKFRCDINLQVEEPPEGDYAQNKNKELFERVELIRRRLRVLQSSEFFQKLSKAKPVRPPIQKTNLLMKNVDYNNCYKLWLFISSYTYLGYSVAVQDKNLPVDGDYYDDLTVIAGLSVHALLADNVLNKDKYRDIDFSEPVEKEYSLITNYSFVPDFGEQGGQPGAETINEYYFRRMKDELVKTAQEGEVAIENKLNLNFTKFFRSVSRINDAMYDELIEEQIESNRDEAKLPPLEAKRLKVKEQRERIRRRRLFLKLKWEELERAQRMVERAEAKLEKLSEDVESEKRKSAPRRVTTIKRVKKKTDK